MTLDCIDALKESTCGRIPIALTDTQSPLDTATLILDACECFCACYTEPKLMGDFLKKIADLVIEFSRVQMARIGPELLAQPGHVMPSFVGGPGVSISDDNLAVASPWINEQLAIPADLRIAEALGGVAIHSCGTWTDIMATFKDTPGILAVESCAGPEADDPQPTRPEDIRNALVGSGIIVKARLGGNIDAALDALDELADPDLKLIVEIGFDEVQARENYMRIRERLERIYHS